MARDNEFVDCDRGSGSPFGYDNGPCYRCPIAGAPAPGLYHPVVAFVRTHLLDRLDPYDRGPSTPITSRVVDALRPRPPILVRPAVEIEVDARTGVEMLDVASWWSDTGGHSFRYCLHVVDGPGIIIVVVSELWSSIS